MDSGVIDGYRLKFEDKTIPLPDAVALMYYFFVINLSINAIGLRFSPQNRQLKICMDKFPTESTLRTDFLKYVTHNSKTYQEIGVSNKKVGLEVEFGNMGKWRRDAADILRDGKLCPYFIFPDWLCRASIGL